MASTDNKEGYDPRVTDVHEIQVNVQEINLLLEELKRIKGLRTKIIYENGNSNDETENEIHENSSKDYKCQSLRRHIDSVHDKVLANVPKKKPKRRKCQVCLRWSKNLDNHTCKEEYLQEALQQQDKQQNNNYENGNNHSNKSTDGTEIKPDDIKKENVVTGNMK